MVSLLQKIGIVVLIILVLGLSVAMFVQQPKPPVIPYKPSTLISIDSSPHSSNITQGSTLNVNLTITSSLDIPLSLPFENLSLSGYNNTSWKSSTLQEKIYNYSFTENPLVLPPNETRSCILTVFFAKDAPVGDYLLYIDYGNSSLTHVGGSSLFVSVKS